MVNLELASARRDDRYGIDANGGVIAGMRFAPRSGESSQPGELLDGDCFERMPERYCRPGLDLDEHEFVAVACDEIDLALAAAPIALDDLVTGAPQVALGNRLTSLAEFVFRRHENRMTACVVRNR